MTQSIAVNAIGAIVAITCACTSLPPKAEGPAITVCEAALRPVGARILVQGEFGGFGYDTESRLVTIHGEGLCSSRGAGVLFVELFGRDEPKKLDNARPRPKRRADYQSGDTVTVEATVLKVEEGRFTHGDKGIIRNVTR